MQTPDELRRLKETLGPVKAGLNDMGAPGTLGHEIKIAMSRLTPGSKKGAIALLRSLQELSAGIARSLSIIKLLEKSLELDARRLEAIDQDELLRKEKTKDESDKASRRRNP